MSWKHLLLSCALLAPGALLQTACMDCTQVGCGAQLTIEIEVDPTETHRIQVCRDGLCFGPADVADGRVSTLASTGSIFINAVRFDDTVRVEADIVDSSMSPDSAPAPVEWEVRIEDSMGDRFEGAVTPAYDRHFPNGEACGPTCWTAEHTMSAI